MADNEPEVGSSICKYCVNNSRNNDKGNKELIFNDQCCV